MTIPYDEEIALTICGRLIEGESLERMCEDPKLPSERTIRRWLAVHDTFWRAYARARAQQMEKWADEIVTIADDASNDYMDRIGKDGEVERVLDPEAVQRSKLKIDTRKFLMSKLAPRTYGDKVDVNLSGSVEVSALSDEELEARTRARLVALGVEVAAPMLLAMPGVKAKPEPVVIDAEAVEKPTEKTTPDPRSTRKKSANDLLDLVI